MTYIYIVETRGSDYYDQLEFYHAYANEADAKLKAATLEAMVEDGDSIYDEVTVSRVILH